MRVRIVRTELTSEGVVIDLPEFGALVNETCEGLENQGFKVVDIDFDRFRSHATAYIKYRKPIFWIL